MQSKLLPALVITALFSVAVFGFLGMGMVEHDGAHSCLFALAGNEPCSALQNAVAVAAHYLDMIGWLSGALASFDVFALIFSLLFLLALFVVFAIFLFSPPEQSRFGVAELDELFSKEKQTLLRWLSYHNKRDPYALARVHNYEPMRL